MTDGIYLGV